MPLSSLANGRMDRADSTGTHGRGRFRSAATHHGMESPLGSLCLLQLGGLAGCPMGLLRRQSRWPEDDSQFLRNDMVCDEAAALARTSAETGGSASCGFDVLSISGSGDRKQLR